MKESQYSLNHICPHCGGKVVIALTPIGDVDGDMSEYIDETMNFTDISIKKGEQNENNS